MLSLSTIDGYPVLRDRPLNEENEPQRIENHQPRDRVLLLRIPFHTKPSLQSSGKILYIDILASRSSLNYGRD